MRRWLCCTRPVEERCHPTPKGELLKTHRHHQVQHITPPPIQVPSLGLDELKEKTDNFGPGCLIGQGVYYANLNLASTEKAVAIRKLDGSLMLDSDLEFLTHVSMASKLKHENVVELLGYCVRGDVRCLAYEYATMGSLHHILHGAGQPGLDWMQRLRIAVDAARGLEYLHQSIEPSIIHREIRSLNVLLFENFKAKIDYFDAPHLRSGAFRYPAPEYLMTGQWHQKSDVYMFGVVLLELLTGRKAIDLTLPRGQQGLVVWATPRLSEDKVNQCLDPKLKGEYPPKGVAKLAAVAASCVQFNPDHRPKMGIVVKVLQSLLNPKPPTRTPTSTRSTRCRGYYSA